MYRQLPDARLLVAPNSPHTVMVAQPALFNQAAANFYRSDRTGRQDIGRRRRGRTEQPPKRGDGAALYEPTAVAVADDDQREPFSNW